ncbi:MAG TPA: NAD(P)/FAD-dependent oxidoreductase [Vicinamibacterales bacterium]|nr:NAD(P)/FAD-dependent oxidoreductase [Vicinamibacterales bacterium]
MRQLDAEVLIAGGGPAGLHAAEQLARHGVDVLVCEEHARVGDPVHCTGILATESFDEFDLPSETSLNTLSSARFHSPSGLVVPYFGDVPVATVIDRPAFDRVLAARAERAGARVMTAARVASLETGADGVRAVVGDWFVTARLALLACGATYGMQRRLRLGLPLMHLQTAQSEIPCSMPPVDVELHFGREVAPDGFAWLVPVHRQSGASVRIGVMASSDALGCYQRFLDKVKDRCGLKPATAMPRLKILPLGAIDRTYADRLLVVGDAAGLVKPTTGGGIYYSLLSARLASDVAADALRRDRLDAAALSIYESSWRERIGDELQTQTELRRAVTRLSDAEINGFFDLALTDGIMPIVRSTVKFNQHRDLIKALFRHPPARQFLFRAIVS